MVKILKILSAICLLSSIMGCAPTAEIVSPGGPTIEEARTEPAVGNKLRIAVMDFDNRSQYEVGRGMGAMLTSALFRTNRFIVLERGELRDVITKQQLGETGVISPETAVPTGEVEGAEVLIYGTVTTFEPDQKGVVTIAGGAKQSQVEIDIKIVDARTSRIIGVTTVRGNATDVNLSTSALKYAGLTPLYYLEILCRNNDQRLIVSIQRYVYPP
ncbi:MAG: hypothetical protein HY758_10865 [Nitrospirae bacterium]|nr:hypothetical protein [Nitrospirota bacterium]